MTTEHTAMGLKRYALTLDLKDDASLIAEYKKHHERIWPEIEAGIRQVGILSMEIYLLGNRMFMLMETPADFDFDRQMSLLGTLPRQQEWEELMWKYQQPLPQAAPGEKWLLMEKVFHL